MALLSDVPSLPQGTPNPLRSDGLYPVLVSPGVFESLVDRVEWGEPDEAGFYTPTLYRSFRDPAVADPTDHVDHREGDPS